MARAWLDQDVVTRLDIIDPAPCGIDDTRVIQTEALSRDGQDILILAVKPQIIRDVLDDVSLSKDTLVLSIAAGQSLSTLQRLLGDHQPIVRSMPNTPAAIGKGVSVSVANAYVSDVQRQTAERFMAACGDHHWIEDESLMDGVTALSGSGPAYVFYLIESLSKAGQATGLSEDLSIALARQTVIGSASLAEADSGTPVSILRENVASPHGTTQAGLDVLMDGRFEDILTETVRAAQKRSIELNG